MLDRVNPGPWKDADRIDHWITTRLQETGMPSHTITLPYPRYTPPAPLRQGVEAAAQALLRGFHVLTEWQRRDEQRRHLAAMDARLMADAGITEEMVAREVSKPFWIA
jgi:uncharacterized protein YjiS (DUF1127 family)